MNERELIQGLRQQLDHGLNQLPEGVLQRLSQARQQAVASLPRQHPGQRWLTLAQARPLFAALLLAIGLGLTHLYIQDQNRIQEMATVDGDLLVDDLPPKAFTDPGFRAWLEESSEG